MSWQVCIQQEVGTSTKRRRSALCNGIAIEIPHRIGSSMDYLLLVYIVSCVRMESQEDRWH